MPRRTGVYTVGIVGFGPFFMEARRRLDAFVWFNYVAHRKRHIITGCNTRFERRTLLRGGVLKGLPSPESPSRCW